MGTLIASLFQTSTDTLYRDYKCQRSNTYHVFIPVPVKPSEAPLVVGLKTRYRVGETLEMQCFINNTYPAANITWFINGMAVRNKI
jgi:hypothetical protein